jgi:hypothetical protein
LDFPLGELLLSLGWRFVFRIELGFRRKALFGLFAPAFLPTKKEALLFQFELLHNKTELHKKSKTSFS